MSGRERRNPHLAKQVVDAGHTNEVEEDADQGLGQPLMGKRSEATEESLMAKIKQNMSAGIIVALVNLPLSISLAVAAKSRPQAGVITAIVAGFISGALGGSHFNIIGPTGALSGYLASAVMKYQPEDQTSFDILPVFAVCTGLLTALILIMQLAKYIELFPSSVNEGFTLGVAVIIFSGQLNSALGLDHLHRHEELIMNIYESFSHIGFMNPPSIIISSTFIIGFFILVKIAPKVPWQTLLTILGIILGATIAPIEGVNLPTLFDKYGDLSFEGELFIKDARLDVLSTPAFYVELMPITFVAILETLISAKIADKMTNTKFEQVPEMVSLALSNVVSGAMGGIPCTAALARTALNVKSGATHKSSAFINSVVMVLVCLFLFPFFKYLPMAVVAAQVMTVAIRMVDYHSLEFYWKADKEQFWIMITVASVSILADTTYGLIVGMFVYLFKFAEKMMEAFSEITIATQDDSTIRRITDEQIDKKKAMVARGLLRWQNPDKMLLEQAETLREDVPVELQGNYKFILYRFVGVINFMNISQHEEKIKLLPEVDIVVLSLRFVYLLDLESLGALKQIIDKLEKKGMRVILSGISENMLYDFNSYSKEWLDKLIDTGKIWELKSIKESAETHK
jgi:SulP family sulfate permease